MIGKSSYPEYSRKRDVRKKIIGTITKKNAITLLGSSYDVAKKEMISFGVKNIISYEIDRDLCNRQKEVADDNTLVKLGNIMNVFIDDRFFYDVDVCGNVDGFGEVISRLKDQDGAYTFSLRGIGTENTVKYFMERVQDTNYKTIPLYDGSTMIDGEKYSFIYKTYGGTGENRGSPMIIIRKLLNK